MGLIKGSHSSDCMPDGDCSPYEDPCDPDYDPDTGCGPDSLTECSPDY